MLAAAVRSARAPARAVARQQARALSIPVNHVVRGAEFSVKDEPQAEKADAIAAELNTKLTQAVGDGYVGYNRFVCKAKWDYKVFYEFNNLDAFGKFLKGEQKGHFDEAVRKFQEVAVDGKVHEQNFVFDKKH